jgi:hypothetical protein
MAELIELENSRNVKSLGYDRVVGINCSCKGRFRLRVPLAALARIVFATLLLGAAGCNGSGGSQNASQTPGPNAGTTGPAFTSVNIDYAPEGRCSDNNWTTSTPAACNPQLSFTCPASETSLSNCPTNCQACYNGDIATIQNTLKVGAITIYQPNYYILKAAQTAGVKVVLGLFDDSVQGLAQPNSATNCTYSGFPFPYCGTSYAQALFNGACGSCTPWNPSTFCGAGTCGTTPTYVAALNSSLGEFLQNGTIIAIQLGNEILCTSAPCQSPSLPAATISTAAQNLRSALNAAGFGSVKVVVSLIEGQAASFCSAGAPPAGVDYIADHVYCSNVAGLPPSWPSGSDPGQSCWQEVQSVFASDQNACGAANVFLGETGYNTGCPNVYGQQQVANEESFIGQLVGATCQSGQVSGPLAPFLFEFGDVCPAGGCLAGCAGQPQEGNGYFGIYYTQGYETEGPLEAKFTSVPSLACP